MAFKRGVSHCASLTIIIIQFRLILYFCILIASLAVSVQFSIYGYLPSNCVIIASKIMGLSANIQYSIRLKVIGDGTYSFS